MGYRMIVYVDLGFTLILIIMICFYYFKGESSKVFNIILSLILLYISIGFIVPGFDYKNKWSNLVVGLMYLCPAIIYFLVNYIIERNYRKYIINTK